MSKKARRGFMHKNGSGPNGEALPYVRPEPATEQRARRRFQAATIDATIDDLGTRYELSSALREELRANMTLLVSVPVESWDAARQKHESTRGRPSPRPLDTSRPKLS